MILLAGDLHVLVYARRHFHLTPDRRPGSDLDVGAWWGENPPASWDLDLPTGVDVLVLDEAPLELAGRVALHGRLLFDDDPPARVRWQAQTRLLYLDEIITAIEGCLNVAQHLCASEGWGPPAPNADALRLLGGRGVVAIPLAESMARAVGFRNVLVHGYELEALVATFAVAPGGAFLATSSAKACWAAGELVGGVGPGHL